MKLTNIYIFIYVRVRQYIALRIFILKTLNVTKVSGTERKKNTKKMFNHVQGNRRYIVCITFSVIAII